MNNPQAITPWFQTSLFSAIIGAVAGSTLTAIVTIVTFIITNKYNDIKQQKNLLISIIQNNSKLFLTIYQGAVSQDESEINYVNLREQLLSTSIIFLLPKDLKEIFNKLYKIHFGSTQYYLHNKCKIKDCLKEIKSKLDEYGVDIFGNK